MKPRCSFFFIFYSVRERAKESTSILTLDESPMTTLLCFREYWPLQMEPKLKRKGILNTKHIGGWLSYRLWTKHMYLQRTMWSHNSSSIVILVSALLWFAAWPLPASKYPVWQRGDLLYTQVRGDRESQCAPHKERRLLLWVWMKPLFARPLAFQGVTETD